MKRSKAVGPIHKPASPFCLVPVCQPWFLPSPRHLGAQGQAPLGRKTVLLSDYFFFGGRGVSSFNAQDICIGYFRICRFVILCHTWLFGGGEGGSPPSKERVLLSESLSCMLICASLREACFCSMRPRACQWGRGVSCMLSTLQKTASAPWGDVWGVSQRPIAVRWMTPCSCPSRLLLLP